MLTYKNMQLFVIKYFLHKANHVIVAASVYDSCAYSACNRTSLCEGYSSLKTVAGACGRIMSTADSSCRHTKNNRPLNS